MRVRHLAAIVSALITLADTGYSFLLPENSLTEKEKCAGWRLLFDGTSTTGWRRFNQTTIGDGWIAEDGTLKGLGRGGDTGGEIVYYFESFGNFELSLDWKLAPGGNSGVFYHVVEGGQYEAAYETGPEYQVLDDLQFPERLETWQTVGADYAMYEPAAGKIVKAAGEWNSTRIVFTARKVEYYLNGSLTVSFVPWSDDWNARKAGGKWKEFPDYGAAKTGYIALQDHGSEVQYKNIKIRPLD